MLTDWLAVRNYHHRDIFKVDYSISNEDIEQIPTIDLFRVNSIIYQKTDKFRNLIEKYYSISNEAYFNSNENANIYSYIQ